ncbi:MAG: tetratricopeptide repeat protein, partial [Gammaproteobacteria bacterium]|nr:tetratricopeptide repeat protein [Gammaproteobacteria bacterium]
PFFIVLYEWYFFQDLSWSWLKRRAPIFLGLLVFLAVLAVGYLGANPVEMILKSYATFDFTLGERVMTEFRVVIFYISLLLFPHPSRLNLNHDFRISHSLLDPVTTLLSAGTIVGLVGLAIYLARRERLLSFCILWFFGNLVIESSVIGLELVFEHRLYLPSMLISVLAVALYCRYMNSIRWSIAVSCTVVLVLSFWTYQRNDIWSDDVTLWRDVVQKSPNKARPYNNLGFSLVEFGEVEEGIIHYREAIRIKPDYADAHSNLANGLLLSGKTEEGIAHLKIANSLGPLRIKSEHASLLKNLQLGNKYKSEGNMDKAIDQYQQALSIQPGFMPALNDLALAYMGKGDYAKALPLYMQSIKLQPNNYVGYYNMACLHAKQEQIEESLDWLKKAIERGFSDWAFLKDDNDLENIRET